MEVIEKMQAGITKVNITPPVGLELSGWAFGPSVGILDELYAKLLVLESESNKVAIVTTDLIGLQTEYADNIRDGIAKKLNINVENVLISASHTHSGPGTMILRHWGEIDIDYVHNLEKQIIGAVVMAENSMQEARIGIGKGKVEGVGVNRRDGENGSVDPDVGVIRIDNTQGDMIAVLMNYSCHPVAAHNYKNMISADYPGYSMNVIEKAKNGKVMVYQTTGAAGDINPKGLHDIRYAEKIGNMVGGEALKVAESIETQPDLTLSVASRKVKIPVNKLPPAEELQTEIIDGRQKLEQLKQNGNSQYPQLMDAYIRLEWAEDTLSIVQSDSQTDHLDMEIQAIRINNAVLVAIPGELFVDIGLNIKEASPYPYTFIVEMANGSTCYLPTRKAFEKGGYELDFSSKVYGIYSITADTQDIIEGETIKILNCL
ncbi:MAG: Ceramidase alk protein [Candidatus Poribacteria bacterium]|nr:Ceramidase alk protein [Candidatus Poribacteria bacterium]